MALLYPDSGDLASLAAVARGITESEVITTASEVRAILGGLDRQVYPSPFSVRFRPDDIDSVQVAGTTFHLDRADRSVSAVLSSAGRYEPHISAVIDEFCGEGMTALDIGANIGYHTLHLSRMVGDSGRVLALEPSSENCRLLLASARANQRDNISLLPVALDEYLGWSFFTSHLGSNGGLIAEDAAHFVEGAGWIVPTVPLDEVVTCRVHFVKVDVEGAEGKVMAGGRRVLRENRPVVVTELSYDMLNRVSGMTPEDYLDFFEQLGYSCYVLDKDSPGGRKSYADASALLGAWGDDPWRIADLLMLPR